MTTFSTTGNDKAVNRIPPSSVKPTKRDQSKSRKHSFPTQNPRPMDLEPLFKIMDPSDPTQAHKIAQRRKAIAKGKNTVGYAEYLKQVPKEKRRPRSIETPSTPDPTLDMSNSRFNGIVRAWRISLHKYDPPELMSSMAIEPVASDKENSIKQTTTTPTMATPVKAREFEAAAAKGLLVDLAPAVDEGSPISIMSESYPMDDQLEIDVCDDSDDDLL